MKIDINPATILRARGLGDDNGARKHLASTVARLSDPYVPMDTGTLKNSKQIDSEGRTLTYPGPYAHYQYHGEVMAGRAPKQYTGRPIDYHGGPMRGPEWDKRMMADRGDEVTEELAKYVGGKKK